VESGLSYEQSPEGDTDRVLAALDREAVVEAFATALHDAFASADKLWAFTRRPGSDYMDGLARALVAALLGGPE